MLPLVLAGAAIAITCSTTAGADPWPGVKYLRFSEPVPWADHILTWRADDTGSTVTSFVEVVRVLRDEGVFLPPEELLRPVRGRRGPSGPVPVADDLVTSWSAGHGWAFEIMPGCPSVAWAGRRAATASAPAG
jgi:hypothetical protein